jgi:hypothetical protein
VLYTSSNVTIWWDSGEIAQNREQESCRYLYGGLCTDTTLANEQIQLKKPKRTLTIDQ